MIRLTRINHVPLVLNADLIEHLETTPDTVISMTNGQKFVVLESSDDVIRKVIEFRREILKSGPPAGIGHLSVSVYGRTNQTPAGQTCQHGEGFEQAGYRLYSRTRGGVRRHPRWTADRRRKAEGRRPIYRRADRAGGNHGRGDGLDAAEDPDRRSEATGRRIFRYQSRAAAG